MISRISPDVEKIFEQLLWVERRRFRIVESVKAHFGKQVVERVLQTLPPRTVIAEDLDLASLRDERDPADFLCTLATNVVQGEAATIAGLRAHVSIYREHVDEQVLFGARTAGQDAGRSFLAPPPAGKPRPDSLSVPEAVQAIFELNFSGMPGEKNLFPVLRSQGGCSVHFVRSPFLDHWLNAGADPRFLYEVRCEWIRGILDILSPRVQFHSASAIELSQPFGLEHYFLRGVHAGP